MATPCQTTNKRTTSYPFSAFKYFAPVGNLKEWIILQFVSSRDSKCQSFYNIVKIVLRCYLEQNISPTVWRTYGRRQRILSATLCTTHNNETIIITSYWVKIFTGTYLILITNSRFLKNSEKRLLVSSRPSVRRYGITRLPLDEFSWNFIFAYFSKISGENSGLIKTWQE